MTTLYNQLRKVRRRRKEKLESLNRELVRWSKASNQPTATINVEKIKQEISDIENHRINFCD